MALQRCDQDLLNALNLVRIAKLRLQRMRDDGCDVLIAKVFEICKNHVIKVPDMSGPYYLFKSRRQPSTTSNLHHYKNDYFLNILDVQMKELNQSFDVENAELLHCMAYSTPFSKFVAFDVDKLVRMTKLDPIDFLDEVESSLRNQLANYIQDVRDDARFKELKSLGHLCKQLVATGKHMTYGAIFKLVKFALILPVATASVERVFSAMRHVKPDSRNKMGDQWLNDRLLTFVENIYFLVLILVKSISKNGH
ncbi:hypothetical protein LIER_06580 [Lithospermum erythrorhizon]|uniref:HAT C-terminal dimerisation domain-containing protein n=1 Tax=Lithospermum erythrorhizon TaxID=34254 RepID=A0AAV3P655_LITER